MNKINNVLVSSRANKLRLCDIYFDKQIREIKFRTEHEFDWSDVSNIPKKRETLSRFVDENESVLLAIPGGIDPHVHFNTPGFEAREDFYHASKAAIFGGTTTIIDMPCTSLPPITSAANLRIKKNALKGLGNVNTHYWGGVSGCNFNKEEVEKNINELAQAGVVGFKVYMLSGMETYADLNYDQIEFVASVIRKTGLPMAVHAEDRELVAYREKRFKAMPRNDWRAYCESRDVQAEASAVNKLIMIAEKTECKIHVVHLSSELGLKSIVHAQERGVSITTETCPHYLFFTQEDFENKNISAFLKTAPPVKFEEDKKALWKGLAKNSILFVTTDHAGCIPEVDKTGDDFWKIYGGIPGVEHRVPFLFSEGFLTGKLTLEKTIRLLSSNAAEFFNLKGKGSLELGSDSDIVLVDLWNSEIVKAEKMHSKGKHTPFEGVKFDAIVKERFVNGKFQSMME